MQISLAALYRVSKKKLTAFMFNLNYPKDGCNLTDVAQISHQ